jgi:hypothetical protein
VIGLSVVLEYGLKMPAMAFARAAVATASILATIKPWLLRRSAPRSPGVSGPRTG